MQTAIVTGREIKKNKDGKKTVIILQCQITDPEDIQSVELMNQSGEDNNPPNGSRVTIIDVGQAFKIAIASDDDIEPVSDPGEKRNYSTDIDGLAVVADIFMKNDGTIDSTSSLFHFHNDIEIDGYLNAAEKSAEPADPAVGHFTIWQSTGADFGDAGDILIKINSGGTVKKTRLVDFSAIP